MKRLGGPATAVVEGVEPGPAPVATRDEVEAYERKLQRRRWIAYAVLLVIGGGLAGGGVHLYRRYRDNLGRFSGSEVEPNDSAKEANIVPFGRAVNGMIGKRISPDKADVDVYSIDVPTDVHEVSLSVTPLPNMALCTQVFRRGDELPLASFCPGRPELALYVPRFRLEGGTYLLSITEDMNPYEDEKRFVVENVSAEYSLTLAAGSTDAGAELEPNDTIASATPIEPGKSVEATIGWVGDKDFFCTANVDASKSYRFRIEDPDRADRDGVLGVSDVKDGAQRYADSARPRLWSPSESGDGALQSDRPRLALSHD